MCVFVPTNNRVIWESTELATRSTSSPATAFHDLPVMVSTYHPGSRASLLPVMGVAFVAILCTCVRKVCSACRHWLSLARSAIWSGPPGRKFGWMCSFTTVSQLTSSVNGTHTALSARVHAVCCTTSLAFATSPFIAAATEVNSGV